jgi:aryl-alcohol dehydrogenase-like predicted oxidoreductase/predicted kinase
MRLSTDDDRSEEQALATIAAAVDAGVTVFDTAHAYGHGADESGHNERLLSRALGLAGASDSARVVTKGGMTRAGDGWVADGRAKAIRRDCEASLAALGGLAIDLYLLHAPDPRTPWRTSLRALSKLSDEGLVRRIGLSNVNRRLLDEALELAPVAAVQVALSVYDDTALRGGVVERCAQRGIALVAHSPLGGPRRAPRLAREPALSDVARSHGVTAAEVALAWLLTLAPHVVAIPGARRPETAVSAAPAGSLTLEAEERELLDRAYGAKRPATPRRARATPAAEAVLVMGIPGAGKSRLATEYAARGYVRLNRDERAGSLRQLAEALDDELASGTRRVVLDNTYLGRASRSRVVESAARHGASVRCVWLDTPLAQAQVNLVERLLERFGSLPGPQELRASSRREPEILTPTSQMRAARELEPPSMDEGFGRVDRVSFVREPRPGQARAGIFVAARAARSAAWRSALGELDAASPLLVFDWSADSRTDALDAALAVLSAEAGNRVEAAFCPHGGGPPVCWCRPPLPGLALAFARRHGVDPARSLLVGAGPAHRTLAAALGARYVAAER